MLRQSAATLMRLRLRRGLGSRAHRWCLETGFKRRFMALGFRVFMVAGILIVGASLPVL